MSFEAGSKGDFSSELIHSTVVDQNKMRVIVVQGSRLTGAVAQTVDGWEAALTL